MKLGELLDAKRVIVPLRARSVRDATRQLAKTMVASGAVTDEARLNDLLKAEWPEDVVTVQGRAFLPHFRTAAVSRLALALGVAPEPLCLSNDATRCARVVVLVLAPVEAASEYLRAMSAVAGALSSDDVLAGLHAATSPADVLAVSPLGEAPVPADVTVADVMNPSVTSVSAETTLGEAAQLMLQRRVRTVPVTGPGGEVLGELTDGHLMRYLLSQTVSELSAGCKRRPKGPPVAAGVDAASLPVREVMDRAVMCLAEDQTIADVAALMLSKDIDHFPVTRDGALVGFLTRSDIVKKLLRT